jgi:5-methylcytosine-specific restriction endonuclease McrA
VVYHKNDYTCQKCHQKGGILNAHHVMNYASFPEHRLNPDNGITFCKSCHIKFHSKYGNADNNEQQLKEYLSI